DVCVFNNTPTTEIYTLSLHAALPISPAHTHTHTVYYTFHKVPHTLSYTRALTHTQTLTHRLSHTDSHTQTLTHTHALTHTLHPTTITQHTTLTRHLTHTLILTPPHTHTSHYLSFTLPIVCSPTGHSIPDKPLGGHGSHVFPCVCIHPTLFALAPTER